MSQVPSFFFSVFRFKTIGFTPQKTNGCPLKIGGRKMYFLLKRSLSRGQPLVFGGIWPFSID